MILSGCGATSRQFEGAEAGRRRFGRQESHLHDYLHVAHITRGRIALGAGDVEKAKGELASAGEQGSYKAPILHSFGPDFLLAGDLLDQGEKEAVLAYLGQCETFWNQKRIVRWRSEIDRGGRPRMFTGYDPNEKGK